MDHNVDGFAFPIVTDRLDEYQRLSQSAAEIWKEHGALEYREFIGDDMNLKGTLPFATALSASSDETIIFGWVTFESKKARDEANERVAADPRMATMMQSSNAGFDASRMVYGGFRSFD